MLKEKIRRSSECHCEAAGQVGREHGLVAAEVVVSRGRLYEPRSAVEAL